MKVDREPLWKAYPNGYFAMRGTETITVPGSDEPVEKTP